MHPAATLASRLQQRTIHFLLTGQENGELISIDDVRSQMRGALRGRPFVVFLRHRTSGSVPGALWDNAKYALGLLTQGRPARTHALVAGNPAVDVANDGPCLPPAKDQQGVKRHQDDNGDGGPACDTGSFERR
jgi:hypothetical protein